MDVWSDAVREEVRRTALRDFPEFELRFAASYEDAHQRDLAGEAEVVVPGFAKIDTALLDAAPGLRLVHKWGVGLDAIDQDALRRRGIALAVTAGANAGPVAELAIALMLAVYRRIPYVNRALREGRWPTPEMRETCFQIAGKTVGLVGFGAIGRMLARRDIELPRHIGLHRRRRTLSVVNPVPFFLTTPPAPLGTRHHRYLCHAGLLPALLSSPQRAQHRQSQPSNKAVPAGGIRSGRGLLGCWD